MSAEWANVAIFRLRKKKRAAKGGLAFETADNIAILEKGWCQQNYSSKNDFLALFSRGEYTQNLFV